MAAERESDEALRARGLQILERELGPVDAMRFVALFSNASFDYQEWREKTFGRMSVDEIVAASKKIGTKTRKSVLDIPRHNVGEVLKPLSPDDDLLEEMLDLRFGTPPGRDSD